MEGSQGSEWRGGAQSLPVVVTCWNGNTNVVLMASVEWFFDVAVLVGVLYGVL